LAPLFRSTYECLFESRAHSHRYLLAYPLLLLSGPTGAESFFPTAAARIPNIHRPFLKFVFTACISDVAELGETRKLSSYVSKMALKKAEDAHSDPKETNDAQ
jgi:hypothetical protein